MSTIRPLMDTRNTSRTINRSITDAAEVWRAQLLATRDFVKTANVVSEAMAGALAARQASLMDQFQLLRLSGAEIDLGVVTAAREIFRVRAEANAPMLRIAEHAAAIQKEMAAALAPAVRAGVMDWGIRFRELAERDRAVAAELQVDGWWIAPGWPVTLGRRLLQHRRANGKRALDRAICEMYRRDDHADLRAVVDTWMTEPAFKARRRIILAALDAHIRGHYSASIPTLLPLIEGIAFEEFSPTPSTATNVRKLYEGWTEADEHQYTGLLAGGMVAALDLLYETTPFDQVRPRGRGLNRHAVLHGRSIAYGTEANSLRVFLALDQLAFVVSRKREREAEARTA